MSSGKFNGNGNGNGNKNSNMIGNGNQNPNINLQQQLLQQQQQIQLMLQQQQQQQQMLQYMNPMMNPMLMNPMMMNPMMNPMMMNQQQFRNPIIQPPQNIIVPEPIIEDENNDNDNDNDNGDQEMNDINNGNYINNGNNPIFGNFFNIPRNVPKVAKPAAKGGKANMNANANMDLDLPLDINLDRLANRFDNVLDRHQIDNNKKDNSFGIDKKEKNVIKMIKPKDFIKNNFNNSTHPDEIYIVTFLDGRTEEIQACDISEYALNTHKITYTHNQSNAQLNSNKGIIYTRVSSLNNISLETQKQACLDYATKMKIGLVPFGYLEDNGVTGRNGKNLDPIKGDDLAFWAPHFEEGSHLIIYSVDRLTRNLLKGLSFLDDLAKRNISVHFVKNEIIYNNDITAAKKAMVQQELQTAEKYSNDTSEKIKGTIRRLKAAGHDLGRAPYGFKHINENGIRKRRRCNDEYNSITRIKSRYYEYCENFDRMAETQGLRRNETSIIRCIIRWCSREGLKNRKGELFTSRNIKSIIESI